MAPAEPGRVLTRFYLLTGAMALGYGSVITLLARIRDDFGFTDGQVGVIAFAGFSTGFVTQVGLARFADRGYAALLVRAGVACAAIGAGWSIAADQLWQWVGARLLLGLGAGAVGPAVRRVVIARNPDDVGANLGRQASFDMGGFVLGPLLAAGLAEVLGLRAPFVALCAMYVAIFVALWRLDLHGGVANEGSRRVVRDLLAAPAMQSALAASIAFYLTVGMFEALWALVLEDLGASTVVVGVTLSLFTLPMVVLAARGGAATQRRGHLAVVTVSILVAALCTLSYGWLPLGLVLALSFVHAVADAFTLPANQVGVALATPSHQLAAGQGLLGAVGLLVAGVAALTGAQLYGAFGRGFVFTATAAAMLVFLTVARARGRVAVSSAVPRSADPDGSTHSFG